MEENKNQIVCPLTIIQGSIGYCRKDCAWFLDDETMLNYDYSDYDEGEECVFKSIFRAISECRR